jgi:metal-responsive CopG/Arc/MetJ family transcriptional regulator
MATTKVAVTLDTDTLEELDRLVAQRVFPNRSKAIQAALNDKLARLRRSRLARESAKLNPAEEQALAEEGIATELDIWPENWMK